MAIVATEIESIHGTENKRIIFYRCQDHLGTWHTYGPVVNADKDFDAEGFKEIVAEKVGIRLAEVEFNSILDGV